MMNPHSNPPTSQDLSMAPRRGRLLEYSLGAAAVAAGPVTLAPRRPERPSSLLRQWQLRGGHRRRRRSTHYHHSPTGRTNLLLDQGSSGTYSISRSPAAVCGTTPAVRGIWGFPIPSVLGAGVAINPSASFVYNDVGLAVFNGTPQGAGPAPSPTSTSFQYLPG